MEEAKQHHPKKRAWKWILAGSGCLMLLLGGGVIYIYSPLFFMHWVLPTLTDPPGIEVKYESLSGGYSGPVQVHNADFYLEDGDPFLRTSVLESDYNPWGAIFTKTSYAFVFRDAQLEIRRGPNGSSNIDPIFDAVGKENQQEDSEEGGGGFRMSLLGVEESRITVIQEAEDGPGQRLELLDLQFYLTNWIPSRTGRMDWESQIRAELGDQLEIDRLHGFGKGTGQFVLNGEQSVVENETTAAFELTRGAEKLLAEITYSLTNGQKAEGEVSLELGDQSATIVTKGLPLETNQMMVEIRGFDERFTDFVFPNKFPALKRMELTADMEVWNSERGWQVKGEARGSEVALQGWEELNGFDLDVWALAASNRLVLREFTMATAGEAGSLSASGSAEIGYELQELSFDGSAQVPAKAISRIWEAEQASLTGEARFDGSFSHRSGDQDNAVQTVNGQLAVRDLSGVVGSYLVTNLQTQIGVEGGRTNQALQLALNLRPQESSGADVELGAEWESLRPLNASATIKTREIEVGQLLSFVQQNLSRREEENDGVMRLPVEVERLSVQAEVDEVSYEMRRPGKGNQLVALTNVGLVLTTWNDGEVFTVRGEAALRAGEQVVSGRWGAEATVEFEESGRLKVANAGTRIDFSEAPWFTNKNLEAVATLEYRPEEIPRASLTIFAGEENLLEARTIGLPGRTNAVELRLVQASSGLLRPFFDWEDSPFLPFTLEGRADLESIKQLPIQLDGKFEITQHPEGQAEPRVVGVSLQGEIGGEQLRLNEFRAEEQGRDPSFSSEGEMEVAWDFSNFHYNGTTRLDLPAWSGETQSGQIQVEGRIRHRSAPTGGTKTVQHFEGKVAIENLTGDYGGVSVTNLNLRLAADAARTNQSAALELSWQPGSHPPQNLEVVGSWSDLEPFDGRIHLNAQRLDLDPIRSMLTNHISFAGEGEASEEENDNLQRFPVERLEFKANIHNLEIGEITVTNWSSGGVLQEKFLAVDEFRLGIGGGTMKGEMELKLQEGGEPVWALALAVENLPIAPIPRTFFPEMKGVRSAELTMQLEAEGSGISKEALVQNVRASTDLRLDDISMDVADDMAKSWFAPLAGIFVADEFLSPHVRRAYLTAALRGGQLIVEDLIIAGEGFLMMTGAEIPLELPLKKAPIGPEPVAVFASVPVAREMKVVVGDPPPQATHIKLPNFMQIEGTLGNPEISVEGSDFAGSLFEQYAQQIFGSEQEEFLNRPQDIFVTRH